MVQIKSLLATAAYGLTLFGAVFAAPATHASSSHASSSNSRPVLPATQSLAHATQPLVLYRAYYRATELADVQHRVNQHPPAFPDVAGDFSPRGGYYMFMIKEEALYWGNQFSMLPGNTNHFAVATLHFYPDAHNCPVGTFSTADSNWAAFVNGNQRSNAHTLQPPPYGVIEGPLSVGQGNRLQQAVSPISGQGVWQYAIVRQSCLSRVIIAQVENFAADRNWQRSPHIIPRQFRNAGSWTRYCPSCTIQ